MVNSLDSLNHHSDTDAITPERKVDAAVIGDQLIGIDHIAVAVENLSVAERWYTEVLGFRCIERRTLNGQKSGMISAVMAAGPLVFVLIQGTNAQSQVSRYIQRYGQGVQHVALQVRNIDSAVRRLKNRKLDFSTTIVDGPDLRQAFSRRSRETGLMLEFIERGDFAGFSDDSVSSLFHQLEASDDF